jgi:hypothetical protein
MTNYEADEAAMWRREARDRYEPEYDDYAEHQDYLDSLIQRREDESK